MGEFKLILLRDVGRPVHNSPKPDSFCLIQFRSRAELEMAAKTAPERDITADELATWWTPAQTLDYASTCVGSRTAAANAIWQRLVGGLIEAAATTSSVTPKDRDPQPLRTPELIPRHFWKLLSKHGSDLWDAGDVRFFLPLKATGTSAVYQAFGVRLSPDDVRQTLPAPKPPAKRGLLNSLQQRNAAREQPVHVPPATSPSTEVNKGGRPPGMWPGGGTVAAPSKPIEIPASDWSRELVKAIAADIGADTVAYIEVMYPKAIEATSSSFKTSVRNHIYNQIMAAIEVRDAGHVVARLADRKSFRRWWVGVYRKVRRNARD